MTLEAVKESLEGFKTRFASVEAAVEGVPAVITKEIAAIVTRVETMEAQVALIPDLQAQLAKFESAFAKHAEEGEAQVAEMTELEQQLEGLGTTPATSATVATPTPDAPVAVIPPVPDGAVTPPVPQAEPPADTAVAPTL